jgi:hypothetical protein
MGILAIAGAMLLGNAGCGALESGACVFEGGDCEENTSADWCSSAYGTFNEGKTCHEAGASTSCVPPFCGVNE